MRASVLLERRFHVPAFAALVFLLLFARRFAQILHPQVWDEEGVIVTQLAWSGPASLFEPLNGYLVLAPRVLSMLAMLFPLGVYPFVATTLAWLLTVAVATAIAFVPSKLRATPFLAVALLLVPSDPEVFGLPLYTFWWVGALLIAAIFWEGAGRVAVIRLATVLFAGLSSPVIVLAAPFFVWRAVRMRNDRGQLLSAGAAVLCAIVQAVEIHRVMGGATIVKHFSPFVSIAKFGGADFVWNLIPLPSLRDGVAFAVGSAFALFVAYALVSQRAMRSVLAPLVLIWIGTIALSVARVDVAILDPVLAGPRYFFMPFALEAWISIQIAASATSATLRSTAIALLVCSLFNLAPALSRTHDDLAWTSSIAPCTTQTSGTVDIPIQWDGHAASRWTMIFGAATCRRLVEHGLLGLVFGGPPRTGEPMPAVQFSAVDRPAPAAPPSMGVLAGSLIERPGKAAFSLDSVGSGARQTILPAVQRPVFTVKKGQDVQVRGWAYDPDGARAARGVIVQIDGASRVPARYGDARADVRAAFHVDADGLGYEATVPAAALALGVHELSFVVIDATGTSFYWIPDRMRVDVVR